MAPLAVGDRVRLSQYARDHGLGRWWRTGFRGVVTSAPRKGLVGVRRDGLRTASSFAESFWERDPTPPTFCGWSPFLLDGVHVRHLVLGLPTGTGDRVRLLLCSCGCVGYAEGEREWVPLACENHVVVAGLDDVERRVEVDECGI